MAAKILNTRIDSRSSSQAAVTQISSFQGLSFPQIAELMLRKERSQLQLPRMTNIIGLPNRHCRKSVVAPMSCSTAAAISNSFNCISHIETIAWPNDVHPRMNRLRCPLCALIDLMCLSLKLADPEILCEGEVAICSELCPRPIKASDEGRAASGDAIDSELCPALTKVSDESCAAFGDAMAPG